MANSAVQLSDAVATGAVAVVARTAEPEEYGLVRDLVVTTSRRMNAAEKRKFGMAEVLIRTKHLKVERENVDHKAVVDKDVAEHKASLEKESDERKATIARDAVKDQMALLQLQADISGQADERRKDLMNTERQHAGTIAAAFGRQRRQNTPGTRFAGRADSLSAAKRWQNK